MIFFETKIDREIREQIVTALEETIGIPREMWEYKRSKKNQEVMIRQIYIYFLSQYTQHSLIDIATIVGLKNHCTIIQSLNIVKHWMENPEEFIYQNRIIETTKKNYEQHN